MGSVVTTALARCDLDALGAIAATEDALGGCARLVHAVETDVRDRAAFDTFWADVDRHFARVDIVVNLLGGRVPPGLTR